MTASVLETVRNRGPFAADGGRTGAVFERGVLPDGTPVILKHVSPHGLLARMTGDNDRLARLWNTGVFSRIPPEIDHTTLSVEPEGNRWVVVMRDVSEATLRDDYVLSREDNRRVLQAADALHRKFRGERVDGLGRLVDLYALATPRLLRRNAPPGLPLVDVIMRGWELFWDVTDRDVAEATMALLDDPEPLAAELEARDCTLIHGDLRLHNIGLSPDRLVLLDWELAAYAPPAVEFTWYLVIGASRIGATREEIIAEFRSVSGERFDPVALELALVGALVRLGWNKALDVIDNPDPAIRVQEREDLDWWITRVRRALDMWSGV